MTLIKKIRHCRVASEKILEPEVHETQGDHGQMSQENSRVSGEIFERSSRPNETMAKGVRRTQVNGG